MNDDELVRHYRSELTYLRRMGAEFARSYPAVAGRLELGADECADPHVERLLEGFAFLTARIQHQLESELPEISSALLSVLHQQYSSPVPSMAVAQFEVDPEQGLQTSGHLIDKHTPLYAEADDGQRCRFRTTSPVTLWPIVIDEASFLPVDTYGFLTSVSNVASVLSIKLRAVEARFEELELDRLQFYMHGESWLKNTLYERVLNPWRLCVVTEDGTHAYIPGDAVVPCGFGDDEEVLPYPSLVHPGYRILQEYFTFPQKFFFFEVTELKRYARGDRFELLFLFDEPPDAKLVVENDTFRLGCTPIVNLFNKTTEPIRLTHQTVDYRVVPDVRRERTTEIHSVRKVTGVDEESDEPITYEPYYSFRHDLARTLHPAYWHARRAKTLRKDLPGTDLFLRFLDLDFNIAQPPTETVTVQCLCTNRDLAERLLAGTILQIEQQAPLHRIVCLTKPTNQLQPPLQGATLWRLISHLSLNHLSLAEGANSLEALREIIQLGSFASSVAVTRQINGLRGLSSRRVLRHMSAGAWTGYARGLEITLTLDERMYVGHSGYLFAAVLNRFLASHATLNSFTQLVLRSRQREEVWKKFPPMAGGRILL